MSSTVISRKMECIEASDEACERALTYMGIEWQNRSSAICPVVTGRLSASINYATQHNRGNPNTAALKESTKLKSNDYTPKGVVKKNTVVVGTNVEYAEKIENGGAKEPQHSHFLRRGLEENKRTFKNILEGELKGN